MCTYKSILHMFKDVFSVIDAIFKMAAKEFRGDL